VGIRARDLKNSDDVKTEIEKKAREIFPARLAFTKKFFNDVFKEDSEISLRLFFTADPGFFHKTVFSQALMFISISRRANVLEALKLRALFCTKKYQYCKNSKSSKYKGDFFMQDPYWKGPELINFCSN
jgi:hypothetical protein